MTHVLDTTFLSDLRRGNGAALATFHALRDEGEDLVVPTLVVAEYLAGAKSPQQAIETLREACQIEPFTEGDAVEAGAIGRRLIEEGRFPGWSDVFLAGFAAARGGLPIVTRNRRHFPLSVLRGY